MKRLFFILLIILTIVILIPPIYYHYIYPTAGDDTASHLLYFQNMDKPVITYYTGYPPVPEYPLYYGQYIVGKILNALPFDIKVSFLWFHFIMLIVAVWAVGLAAAYSVNYYAGILSGLLVFGRSYLLTQFYWGVIFDIVGIAILLPIFILCVHNMNKGIWWKIGLGVSLLLFAVFHANGKYLYALIPMIGVYELFRHYLKDNKLSEMMLKYRFIVFCGLLGIVLLGTYALGISVDPTRIFLDATVLFIICISCIIALLLGNNWKYALAIFILAFAVSFPQLQFWMKDNSALKGADKEAIAFVNNIPGGSYMVSSEITRNIYGLYIKKQYVHEDGDYLITRSVAMTETSAIAVKHEYKELRLGDYELIALFNTGERENVSGELIEVCVYEKSD